MNKNIKLIFFFLIISLIPILKVNALINNQSTNNILYAQYNSNYQSHLEWLYNTSDDYLFSKIEDYEYKNISVEFLNNSIIIYVYGNNQNKGVLNGYRTNAVTRYEINGSTDVSYFYKIYYNNGNYYSDSNYQNIISQLSDNNIYDWTYVSARNWLWRTNYVETHSVTTNFIPYTLYFSNMTFSNAAYPITNRKLILYDENDDLIGEYQVGDDVPSWRQQYHSLPSYLNGYEKLGLSPSVPSIIISNVQKGSIFIPIEDFNKCYGIFGYFDKEKNYQSYDSIIEDYQLTYDGLYIKQDFDLNNYEGADYVFYQKCQYIEGTDNIYKWLWVPTTSWSSPITSQPNNNGGLDYIYNVKDQNGDIVQESFSSIDGILGNGGNQTINNVIKSIFKSNNTNIINNFNNVWEKLKNHNIYNYFYIIIIGSLVIYFIKLLKR